MSVRSVHDYENLVRRVQRLADASPRGYRLRLALLTLLGFAVPALAMSIAIALAGGVIALVVAVRSFVIIKLLKFAWIPLVLCYMILRALLFKVPAPAGQRIQAADAPALFEAIERLRRVGDSKPVHEVLLSDELNASVTERPAWGMVGPTRRSLILGVPLMGALTPEEFDAVLAHEFGHLARNHTRFSSWIYRTRQSWGRILQQLEAESHFVTKLFLRFYRWFSPYYSAYSYVLAQSNEFEADANAALAAGAPAAGQALVRLEVQARRSQTYWQRLWARADREAEPPPGAIQQYYTMLASPETAELARTALDAAMERQTTLEDTHPSLAARLESLGANPELPPPIENNAAATYLGPLFEAFRVEEDREWVQQVKLPWSERHKESANMLPRLGELNQRASEGRLEGDEPYERAMLVERFESSTAALPHYRRIADADPNHVGAQFACGRILLERGDPDGVGYLDRVVLSNTDARNGAASLLYRHFVAERDTKQASRYEAILDAAHEEELLAIQSRQEVRKSDELEPAHLDEERLALWRAAIASVPLVKKARLGMKRIEARTDERVYIVALRFKMHFDPGGKKDKALNAILEGLSIEGLPQASLMIIDADDSENRWVWRKLGRIDNSDVYP